MTNHVITVKTYFIVYIVLMLLLVATVGAAALPLGGLHLPVAMAIALLKGVLILLIFMHVYYSNSLIKIVSVAALLWATLLVLILVADYFARGWLDIAGK